MFDMNCHVLHVRELLPSLHRLASPRGEANGPGDEGRKLYCGVICCAQVLQLRVAFFSRFGGLVDNSIASDSLLVISKKCSCFLGVVTAPIVEFGGRDVCVPQGILHFFQIGGVFQSRGGKGRPHGMG